MQSREGHDANRQGANWRIAPRSFPTNFAIPTHVRSLPVAYNRVPAVFPQSCEHLLTTTDYISHRAIIMSKKVSAVEEPEIVDEEGEESDDYDDDFEDEEDADAGAEDDEEDEDDAGLTDKGSSLTALLLGGAGENDADNDEENEDEDDEDDEFTPIDIKGPATEAIASAPPPAVGTKRTREDEDANGDEDVSGNYGEFEENSESVKKKARAAAEEEVA
ncbi:hypothetical protein BC629DRAFT_815778 [Irpex lacteus]|nr:hypothetical protein BC629DRAFT_815778 [Irpex lacteus]